MGQETKRVTGQRSTKGICWGKTSAKCASAPEAIKRLTDQTNTTWCVVFMSKKVVVAMLTAAAKAKNARLARKFPRRR